MLVYCLTYTLTLKAEVICSLETSGDFPRTAWLYIPSYKISDKLCLLSPYDTKWVLTADTIKYEPPPFKHDDDDGTLSRTSVPNITQTTDNSGSAIVTNLIISSICELYFDIDSRWQS